MKTLKLSLFISFVIITNLKLFSYQPLDLDQNNVNIEVISKFTGKTEYLINGLKIRINNSTALVLQSLEYSVDVYDPTNKKIGSWVGTINQEIGPLVIPDINLINNWFSATPNVFNEYYKKDIRSHFSFFKPHTFKAKILSLKIDKRKTVANIANTALRMVQSDNQYTSNGNDVDRISLNWLINVYKTLQDFYPGYNNSQIEILTSNLSKLASENDAKAKEKEKMMADNKTVFQRLYNMRDDLDLLFTFEYDTLKTAIKNNDLKIINGFLPPHYEGMALKMLSKDSLGDPPGAAFYCCLEAILAADYNSPKSFNIEDSDGRTYTWTTKFHTDLNINKYYIRTSYPFTYKPGLGSHMLKLSFRYDENLNKFLLWNIQDIKKEEWFDEPSKSTKDR